jgi:hypothetical protein
MSPSSLLDRRSQDLYNIIIAEPGSHALSGIELHGQVGWKPRLPASGAGRKADPIIILSFPGSPAL